MTKMKKASDKKLAKSKNTADESRSSQKASSANGTGSISMERRASKDRRGPDRRVASAPVAIERRQLERRAKVSRRRQIDPTTCERDYSPEEIQFMTAMDEYKRLSGRMFPTCSEILEVLKKLGYEKREPSESSLVSEPAAAPLDQAPQAEEAVPLASEETSLF